MNINCGGNLSQSMINIDQSGRLAPNLTLVFRQKKIANLKFLKMKDLNKEHYCVIEIVQKISINVQNYR